MTSTADSVKSGRRDRQRSPRAHGSWNAAASAPSLPSGGVLRPTNSFADLADLWLADLELRDLASNTKENYRTCLRLHVRPAFEHYALAEVTTGRVEWFLAKQAKVSSCRDLADRSDSAQYGGQQVGS